MKVLVVSTSFPISQGSTSGIFVKRLVDELSKSVVLQVVVPDGVQQKCADFDYPVYCFRYAPKFMQILAHQAGGLPVALKKRPLFRVLIPAFLTVFWLTVYRKSRGVDVIQANWSLPGLIAGIVGRMRGIPVFTTLRGDDVSNLEDSWLKRRILALLLRWNLRLITVSSAMSQDVSRMFPNSDPILCHIPNGVDDTFLNTDPLSKHSGAIKLLYVGSLIPRKQVHVAIEALGETRGEAMLTIVGDGPERCLLEQRVAQLGLSERVEFVGALPASEIPNRLSSHDALILCSRSEGRPNVVIEAMAAGRVVLATRLPGVVEVITHNKNGLLFGIGDSLALAERIGDLEKDPALRVRLGSEAKNYVLDNGLTWERCAQGYIGLFRSNNKTEWGKL